MNQASGTISNTTLDGYLEECFTESVQMASNLKTKIWDGRGVADEELKNFYNSFHQLWVLTWYSLNRKTGVGNGGDRRKEDDLQERVKNWFDASHPSANKVKEVKAVGLIGLGLYDLWVEQLYKLGIIRVR